MLVFHYRIVPRFSVSALVVNDEIDRMVIVMESQEEHRCVETCAETRVATRIAVSLRA